ncbi:MAG: PH domain-containing protein [Alphaproteobacteria bacterium]
MMKKRDKPDIKDMLVNGEEIIEEAIIHNGIYWRSLAVLLLAILVALTLVVELGALLAVVAIIMFAHATLKKEILMCTLTNKRIFVRYGILQVDIVDIRFDKIESIELERMITGYIFGYATLVISGTGNRYIAIPYVENAVDIRRSYNRLTLSDEEETS